MKKSYAILITILLMLPMLSAAVPVRASINHPTLDGYNVNTSTFDTSFWNVSMIAGSLNVTTIDGTPFPNDWLAINMTNVGLSGSQFNIYFSQDGYSLISPGDVEYAKALTTVDLSQPLSLNTNVTVTNAYLAGGKATFWLGLLGGSSYIIGPIPFTILADYKYIKIWDGESAIAVAEQPIIVLPALSLSPTSGPAGTSVTLSGVALSASTLYNITYGGVDSTAAAQVTTTTNGTFAYTWTIEDLCDDSNELITISVFNNATGAPIGNVNFIEYGREILSAVSPIDSSWTSGPYGNNTVDIDVNVLKPLNFEVNYFNPTVPVNVVIDGTTVDTFNTNTTGYYNETITVPVLSLGDHYLVLSNGGCLFNMTIDVQPSLIVTPDSGPIGTNVTFTCYGFQPGFVALYYWTDDVCTFSEGYNWLANATVGADGQFNVTVPWTIPSYPGGELWIYAYSTFVDNYTGSGEIASTYFTVTPSLVATPSSVAANGSIITITGTGLMRHTAYTIDIDNQAFAVPNFYSYTYGWDPMGSYYPGAGVVQYASSVVWADDCGNLAIQLVAAGFRPGEHVVALYAAIPNSYGYFSWDSGTFSGRGFGNYSLNAYVLFTVTTENDTEVNAIVTSMNSTFAAQLQTMGAQITSIQNDVATITTNTGTIQAAVSALDAKVTTLTGNVATVSTNLGTLTGTVTSIQGDVATIKTDVGTIKATTTSIKSFLPVDLTPVWIAVILSLIAAIASIYGIIVIRSKIAA